MERFAVKQHLAVVELRHSEQSERQFGPPGSHQPNDAEHFAGVQSERDVVEFAVAAATPRLEDRIAVGEFRALTVWSMRFPVISSASR